MSWVHFLSFFFAVDSFLYVDCECGCRCCCSQVYQYDIMRGRVNQHKFKLSCVHKPPGAAPTPTRSMTARNDFLRQAVMQNRAQRTLTRSPWSAAKHIDIRCDSVDKNDDDDSDSAVAHVLCYSLAYCILHPHSDVASYMCANSRISRNVRFTSGGMFVCAYEYYTRINADRCGMRAVHHHKHVITFTYLCQRDAPFRHTYAHI